jgi:hypothetical protein
MRFRVAALLLFLIATVSSGASRHNIDTGCLIKQKIQSDGTVQFVDCKGNVVQNLPIQQVQASLPPATSQSSRLSNSADVNLPADSPAADAYQKYLAAYYDYQTHSLSYARSVFDWQYKSSIVIFIMVILLVLSGLGFAGIQFAIAMRAHRMSVVATKDATPQAASGEDDSSSLASTIDLSPQGVKVTSSVIGLLILVVSIGFFYLYLVYVYPITNIAK